jgi:N-acetylmuramic acid 6-phosphate etherase
MALTGSTRMQASSVLMLVVGLALECGPDFSRAMVELENWCELLDASSHGDLPSFIEREAQTYIEGDHTIYSTDEYAITVLTDTTERAPTFNLAPFDNHKHPTGQHSLTYLSIPSTENSEQAWHSLLARSPRPLDWPHVHAKTSKDYLYSFDFSSKALDLRRRLLPNRQHHVFSIRRSEAQRAIEFAFRELRAAFVLPSRGNSPKLLDHLTLKMILNRHSTLVMGRLDRFDGNLMTWVYPSNGKLIDRAARTTQLLLSQRGHMEFSYDEIVRAQFAAKSDLSPTESIVHKTIGKLLKGNSTA